MPGNMARHLTATGGVTDVDCIPQVEMIHHDSGIGRVVVHIMTVADLAGATMAAPIMGDDRMHVAATAHPHSILGRP